jgi:hypothetical protein
MKGSRRPGIREKATGSYPGRDFGSGNPKWAKAKISKRARLWSSEMSDMANAAGPSHLKGNQAFEDRQRDGNDCATLAPRRCATALPGPVFHRQDRVSFA